MVECSVWGHCSLKCMIRTLENYDGVTVSKVIGLLATIAAAFLIWKALFVIVGEVVVVNRDRRCIACTFAHF